MSGTLRQLNLTSTSGGGRRFLSDTTATALQVARPLVLSGVPLQQVLGSFSGPVSVAIPALAANATVDVPFSCALSTFPAPFTLAAQSTGLIDASAFFQAAAATGHLMTTLAALSLSFGSGFPNLPGSGTWTLVAGTTYQGSTIHGTVRCFAAGAATAAESVTVIVQAKLLGVPSQ